MTVTERIFYLLSIQNKSIQSLCDYIHVSSSVVANWKSRSDIPPSKYLLTICEFLEVSLDYLFTGKEPTVAQANSSASALPTILSDDETSLIKLYRKLPERKQNEFIGELKGYIKCLSDISQADPLKKIAE